MSQDTLKILEQIGYDDNKIKNIINSYPESEIKKHAEYMKEQGDKIQNPQGYLISSLSQGWNIGKSKQELAEEKKIDNVALDRRMKIRDKIADVEHWIQMKSIDPVLHSTDYWQKYFKKHSPIVEWIEGGRVGALSDEVVLNLIDIRSGA